MENECDEPHELLKPTTATKNPAKVEGNATSTCGGISGEQHLIIRGGGGAMDDLALPNASSSSNNNADCMLFDDLSIGGDDFENSDR